MTDSRDKNIGGAIIGPPAASPILRIGRLIAAPLIVLGDLFDRTFHSVRRIAARRRLAQGGPYRSALFICRGNLCRSPFAAALLERSVRGRLVIHPKVTSAGFIRSGRPAPSAALAAAERHSVDLSNHRSEVIAARALAEADLVVVMESDQAADLRRIFGTIRATVLVLGDLDPGFFHRRTIVDPWNSDDSVFEASYARIERCVEQMTRILEGSA